MQRLEVSCAVRPTCGSLGVKRLTSAVDGGEWSVSHLHSSLLGTEPPISLGYEAVDTTPDRERIPCPWQESKLRRSFKVTVQKVKCFKVGD